MGSRQRSRNRGEVWGAGREAEAEEGCRQPADKLKQGRGVGSRQRSRGGVWGAGREEGEGCGKQAEKQ